MTAARFRVADLVDLGNGYARFAEPGEELFRIIVAGCPYARWMTEGDLAELELYGMPAEVESMVAPGRPAVERPDPRQMELPLEVDRDDEPAECAVCGVEERELVACFGCDGEFCVNHSLGHDGCPYTEGL